MINLRWCVVALTVGCALGCASGEKTSTALLAKSDAAERRTYAISIPEALPDRLEIPLVRSGGYLLVPSFIEGQSAGLMMIDTGASLSVIAQGVAGRLGLETDGRGRTLGVGGFEEFDYFRADHFSIGLPRGAPGQVHPTATRGVLKLEREKLAGLRMLDFGRSLGVGLAGIVAFTDFADVPFTLDTPGKMLTVHRPRGFQVPPGATRHRLRNFRRLPMVRAELDDGTQRVEVWLIIDYGADHALTLPAALLERHPGVVAVNASGIGRTRGVGGTVASTQTWVKHFQLLGLDLENIPVNFETPPPTMRGPQFIGRVGNALLQHFRLTFHPAHGWVYAEWEPAEQVDN